MTPSRLAALSLLTSGLLCAGAGHARADATIAFTQDSFQTGQIAELVINADAGSLVILLLGPTSADTVIPGIGTFCVGADAEVIDLGIAPDSQILLTCGFDCGSPIAGVPYYAQVLTVDAAGEICISNCDVLNVTDDGDCDPTGCTPGYWKNHPDAWAPTGYAPGDDFAALFGVDPVGGAATLDLALQPDDNDLAQQTLPAHAVAALLNATHPDANYALSEQQVINLVAEAIASGDPAQMEAVKDLLDDLNNTGCAF